jgi:hypothetical protein
MEHKETIGNTGKLYGTQRNYREDLKTIGNTAKL